MPKQSDVVAFFEEDEAWGCFSNFYSDGHEYDFIIPQEFFAAGFRTEKERTVKCAFSEKAIMLCKAAVMNDEETFQLGSQEQGDARRKGFSISSQTRTPFLLLFSDKQTSLQKFLIKRISFFDVGCSLFSQREREREGSGLCRTSK